MWLGCEYTKFNFEYDRFCKRCEFNEKECKVYRIKHNAERFKR